LPWKPLLCIIPATPPALAAQPPLPQTLSHGTSFLSVRRTSFLSAPRTHSRSPTLSHVCPHPNHHPAPITHHKPPQSTPWRSPHTPHRHHRPPHSMLRHTLDEGVDMCRRRLLESRSHVRLGRGTRQLQAGRARRKRCTPPTSPNIMAANSRKEICKQTHNTLRGSGTHRAAEAWRPQTHTTCRFRYTASDAQSAGCA
jgi:hypothetical protein